MGERQDCYRAMIIEQENGNEKEMRGRCEIKFKKGGQMIKYSRWKGCEGVEVKIKNRKMMEWSQNNEMRGEIKIIERGKTGEDIRRERGEMVGIKT